MKEKVSKLTQNLNVEDARILDRIRLSIGGPVAYALLESVEQVVTASDEGMLEALSLHTDNALTADEHSLTLPKKLNKAQRQKAKNIEKALKMEAEGMTQKEIATAVGVTVRTVQNYLNAPLGSPSRPTTRAK